MSYYNPMKNIKKLLKNQKGMNIIEATIGLLIIVICVGFTVDVVGVIQKHYMVSQRASEISRQIGIQGGVCKVAPTGFPGGDRAYMSSMELVDNLKELFTDIGLEENEYYLNIKNYKNNGSLDKETTLSNNTNFKVDYKNSIDIDLYYTTKWNFMSLIIPGDYSSTHKVNRFTVSEFKYDYDNWGGK